MQLFDHFRPLCVFRSEVATRYMYKPKLKILLQVTHHKVIHYPSAVVQKGSIVSSCVTKFISLHLVALEWQQPSDDF